MNNEIVISLQSLKKNIFPRSCSLSFDIPVLYHRAIFLVNVAPNVSNLGFDF